MFAEHSWYFRNALVRANYKNLKYNIDATSQYLERFLENLLLGENNELRNRELHILIKPESANINIPSKDKKFLVIGKKFLVNNKKFPVIGLEIIKIMKNNPSITIMNYQSN